MNLLHLGMGTATPTACPFGSSLAIAGVPDHANKKADAVEHPEVFDHVGLLYDQPPGLDRVAIHPVIRLGSCFARSPFTILER